MGRLHPDFRPATLDDSVTIAALSVQVFLDTYATEGIRPDLAREAFSRYSAEAFVARLAEPDRRFLVSEHATGLLGFAELLLKPLPAPAGAVVGAELVRLYVQPQCHGMGIGRQLLQIAESAAAALGLTHVWLTAWEGNHRARGFYEAVGYSDVGATTYTLQGNSYGNRVFAKRLSPVAKAAPRSVGPQP
jgi:ribosomal protein S18 acetylase RimI-like enzyme